MGAGGGVDVRIACFPCIRHWRGPCRLRFASVGAYYGLCAAVRKIAAFPPLSDALIFAIINDCSTTKEE